MTEISDALIRDIQAAMAGLVRQQRPGLSHEVVQLDTPGWGTVPSAGLTASELADGRIMFTYIVGSFHYTGGFLLQNITGTTANAHTSIAVLRALFTDQLRLISVDESQPPPIDPASAAT